MRIVLFIISGLIVFTSFSQIELKGYHFIGPNNSLWSFKESEVIISDLESSHVFELLIGEYSWSGDTLLIDKNDKKNKKNGNCAISVFCSSISLNTLKFVVDSTYKRGFTLRALNSTSELIFEVLSRPMGMDYGDQKKFLKNKGVRETENKYVNNRYEKIRRQDFLKLQTKDEVKYLEYTSSFVNSSGPIVYFDLLLDSTGYFVARDIYWDMELKEIEGVNYYQGKLSDAEYSKLNDIYSKSGFNIIKDSSGIGKFFCNHTTTFSMWYRSNQGEFKKIRVQTCQLKSYMQEFQKYVATFFRQTKYQGEDHHYNFTKSLYKKK